jgi:uncharacterized protein (TIGR04255 family)
MVSANFMEKVEANRYLNPPKVQRVRYARNFIKTAVCELRFPALLELETKPPRAFQKEIRKTYPFYEPQIVEMGSGSDDITRENRYLFRSKDKQWTVSVKSFSLALETSKYVDFEDFFQRLTALLERSREMIDADFFTRVGLRYINNVPLEDGIVDGWIRAELLSPLMGGVLGVPKSIASVVSGEMDGGFYTLRHGRKDENAPDAKVQQYTLDFDYYAENVEAKDVPARVKQFNEINFALFSWCLGDKARKLLGEGRPK